jgi:hypothetical protein
MGHLQTALCQPQLICKGHVAVKPASEQPAAPVAAMMIMKAQAFKR